MPLSAWALVAGAALVLLVGALVTGSLLEVAGSDPRLQVEAIRTGLAAAGGTGGGLALLLAFRRQRTTEISTGNEITDTEETRITEIYDRGVAELGARQAIVRLGGLYALERLGDEHPKHRQTVVNVLCGYLRMPATFSADPPPAVRAVRPTPSRRTASPHHSYRQCDHEVRRTAQRILVTHLRRPEAEERTAHGDAGRNAGDRTAEHRTVVFWDGINLDLTGARLDDLDMTDCRVQAVRLTDARLGGRTLFVRTAFAESGRALFDGAVFDGCTSFSRASFGGPAVFDKARFRGAVHFDESHFRNDATFRGTAFDARAGFTAGRFDGAVVFDGSSALDEAVFDEARTSSEHDVVTLPRGWTLDSGRDHENCRMIVRDDPPLGAPGHPG